MISLNELAAPIGQMRFTSAGPGVWWFVAHPDGFLIEVGDKGQAEQIAKEINAGRAALASPASGEDAPSPPPARGREVDGG